MMGQGGVDYAAMGKALADAIPPANAMSAADVKFYKSKVYNLFQGVSVDEVDFAVATYFVLNDPSPRTVWATAHPLIAGGKTVPITAMVGQKGFLPVDDGSGRLRKFLSGAYEVLVPLVIKHVPTVAQHLRTRLAERGLEGADPISAVSWIRTGAAEIGGATGARAAFKHRSINARGSSGSAVQVAPYEEPAAAVSTQGRGGGAGHTFY
jgi:hypothetical protein